MLAIIFGKWTSVDVQNEATEAEVHSCVSIFLLNGVRFGKPFVTPWRNPYLQDYRQSLFGQKHEHWFTDANFSENVINFRQALVLKKRSNYVQSVNIPDSMLTLGQRWHLVGYVGVGVWSVNDVGPTLAQSRRGFRWHYAGKWCWANVGSWSVNWCWHIVGNRRWPNVG